MKICCVVNYNMTTVVNFVFTPWVPSKFKIYMTLSPVLRHSGNTERIPNPVKGFKNVTIN